MKSNSPKSLAFTISVTFTAIFLLFMLAFSQRWIPEKTWVILVISLVILVILYGINVFILRKFIYKKILPIYRVIRKSGVQAKKGSKAFDAQNPIDKIYTEVDDWAQTKNTEIAQLKANEKFRQEFIGNVSHELKTPIFNIQGYILTLLEGGLEDPGINRLYLERAEKSINRMIQIVKDLEYIARIESGELLLETEKFNLVKLVEEVFELHEMPARKRSVKLQLVYKADKPVMVMADRKRIIEVMSNLVINAINYGRKEGFVKVDFLDMERHVLVEVAYDGLGIAPDQQKRIFERFYRVDKSRSRDQGGTGLGLSIVKHFIEAHGQTINIQSELGEGTAFTFTLPKA